MAARQRIAAFDIARGCAVVSMVAFHTVYDLIAYARLDLPWFHAWPGDVWRASIAWTFLILAGRMFSISHSNYRRAVRYLLVAALIFCVTAIVAIDVPISFGIIFCMGASTLVFAALRSLGRCPETLPWAVVGAVAFILCLRVPAGTLGVGPLSVALPRGLYGTPWLSWLGFPGPGFASGDYYPLLPYGLLYGAGVAWGFATSSLNASPRLLSLHCRPLEFLGRHSLVIYVFHQAAIIGVLWLLGLMGTGSGLIVF